MNKTAWVRVSSSNIRDILHLNKSSSKLSYSRRVGSFSIPRKSFSQQMLLKTTPWKRFKQQMTDELICSLQHSLPPGHHIWELKLSSLSSYYHPLSPQTKFRFVLVPWDQVFFSVVVFEALALILRHIKGGFLGKSFRMHHMPMS